MSYYDINADEFIENTLNVDMTELYQEFTSILEGNTILDIGCGAGRDLKHFTACGYTTIGLEPSAKLAKFAREFSSCEVIEKSILDFEIDSKFDGIWACASLLHLTNEELKKAFILISKLMKSNSVLYCSFKSGEFEGERNGRFFNDQTTDSIKNLITKKLQIKKSWITADKRPKREDNWLNLLIELKHVV